MFINMNLAGMRDYIRRVHFNQVPPIDDGTGISGAQPTRYPFPSNYLLNDSINRAVAWADAKCHISGDPVPRVVPIPGQTAYGPFALDLNSFPPYGSLTDVRRVTWRTVGGYEQPLDVANREELDRLRYMWMNDAPGTPLRYWIEAGKLLIHPAPSSASELLLMAGSTLWSRNANADGETLEIVPAQFLPVILAKAFIFAAESEPDDVVYAAHIKVAQGEVTDGQPDMQGFFARRNRMKLSHLEPETGRTGQGYIGGRR